MIAKDPMSAFQLAPKELFRMGPHAELHNDFAETLTAHAGLSAALAEMTHRMEGADNEDRAHNASKLEGAREFVKIWLNIGRALPMKEEAAKAMSPMR